MKGSKLYFSQKYLSEFFFIEDVRISIKAIFQPKIGTRFLMTGWDRWVNQNLVDERDYEPMLQNI